ncbi:MAG TPA: hypothetical protein VGX68_24180 [Thermoanaerobaculia bacterium]|jgi:hypothetical protein|nr:hypothetical protein [Thermoanaerobaculia bacterium]
MNRNRQAFLLFLFIAAGLGPRQLAAQLTPAGPETRVDTATGDLEPRCPKIAVAPDHSFEIVWGYEQRPPPEVKARHYDASGLPTDPEEVLVAAVEHYAAAVDIRPVATGFQVLLRVLDDFRDGLKFLRDQIGPDGVPAGSPRQVGAATTQWVSSGPGDTVFAGTYNRHRFSVQKVDGRGRPTGRSYILNSRPIEDVLSTPVLAPLPGGRWVAVFTGNSVARPRSRARPVIRARLFNARGPEGPDFDVNSTPLGTPESATRLDYYYVVVASSPSGFAISWDVGDATGAKLRVRFYNATGVAQGDEVTVATHKEFIAPLSGAFDGAGRLLLLWGAGTGGDPDFQAQLFDASGAPAGPSFKPDTAASGAFTKPFCGSVAPAGDSWLITWAAHNDVFRSSIFVRRFD